jgi:hypothetical protein
MHPILIDLGFYQLPTYGVLVATAVAVALSCCWWSSSGGATWRTRPS